MCNSSVKQIANILKKIFYISITLFSMYLIWFIYSNFNEIFKEPLQNLGGEKYLAKFLIINGIVFIISYYLIIGIQTFMSRRTINNLIITNENSDSQDTEEVIPLWKIILYDIFTIIILLIGYTIFNLFYITNQYSSLAIIIMRIIISTYLSLLIICDLLNTDINIMINNE